MKFFKLILILFISTGCNFFTRINSDTNPAEEDSAYIYGSFYIQLQSLKKDSPAPEPAVPFQLTMVDYITGEKHLFILQSYNQRNFGIKRIPPGEYLLTGITIQTSNGGMSIKELPETNRKLHLSDGDMLFIPDLKGYVISATERHGYMTRAEWLDTQNHRFEAFTERVLLSYPEFNGMRFLNFLIRD